MMAENETYKMASGGIQGGYQGAKYQIKLLQLFAIRAMKKKLEFNVWTEDESADKFDDLLFSYFRGNQTRYTFLQAKNKVNHKKLELSTLFNDKNYNLYKYFKSFTQIEDNFKIDYKLNDIDDLIISTNNVFPTPTGNCLRLTEVTSYGNSILQLELFSHGILKSEGKLFKFDKRKENENCEVLKMRFLAIELIQLLFDPNCRTYFIQHSKDFLESNIFEINGNSIEFKDEFLNTGDPDIESLRSLLKDAIQNGSIAKHIKEKTTKSFAGYFNNFKFDKGLVGKINAFDTNTLLVESQIKRFMSKLFFASEVDEFSLDRSISLEILTLINDSSQLNDTHVFLEAFFDGWLCAKNEFRVKLNYSDILNIFSPIFLKNLVERLPYEFAMFPSELSDFFDYSSPIRTMIYQVSKGETFLGCLKIQSLNKSVVFLNSDSNEYDRILKIFENSTNEFCLVIEATEKADAERLKNFIRQFERASNAKLVVVCEGGISKSLDVDTKLIESSFKCEQLSQNDLKIMWHKTVLFQGASIQLKELIEFDQVGQFMLKQIEGFTAMGASWNPPEIYLHRKLSKIGNYRNGVLENLNGTITISDKDFPTVSNQINIIKGLPGMGKSLFLDYLSCKLKKIHKNLWIQKFELQTYIDELQNFEDESMHEKSAEEILNFFVKEFIKVESNLVERTAIENLFKTGKVILMFDGFDEIGDDHKEALLKIISALKTCCEDIKFYITTRPEWSEFLENRFAQRLFFFEPFTSYDQESYILQLWKKDNSWKNVAKEVLNKLNESINEREKTFTGTPLITRLIADYFLEKIGSDEQLKESLATNLSFYKLMEYFINRKFDVYFVEKLKMKKNHPALKKQLKDLISNHKKLALQLVFPEHNFFPTVNFFDEDSVNEFVRCGLVQYINGKLKFIHQTIAEFFATLYLMENLKDTKNLKFLFEVVLAGDGYAMIRFLVNFIFKEVLKGQNKQFLSGLVQENRRSLVIAASESNLNIFNVSFDILYGTVDEEYLKKLLLLKETNPIREFYNCNLLYILFTKCEVTDTEFLDEICKHIGLESVKEILRARNTNSNHTILHAAGFHGKNYLILTKWILEKFSNDHQFIRETILFKAKHNSGIFCEVFKRFHKQSLIGFFETLKSFDSAHHTNLLSDLLLDHKPNGTFVYHLIFFHKFNLPGNEIVEIIMDLLHWVKANTEFFEKFIQLGSNSVLHLVAENFKTEILHFMDFLFKLVEPDRVSQLKNHFGKSLFFIFDGFRHILLECNFLEIFISLGKFLEENFHDFTAKEFLLEEHATFLYHIFRCALLDLADQVLDWIAENDMKLFSDLVHKEDASGRTAMHIMCQNVPRRFLPKLFKKIINTLRESSADFNLGNLLNAKDKNQKTFLNYIFYYNVTSEAAEDACEILTWLLEIDFDLAKQLIYNKDKDGTYFIHDVCIHTDKKYNFLKFSFEKITQHLSDSFPDLNLTEYLNNKNKEGKTCLDLIAPEEKEEKLEIENLQKCLVG